jgi:hypothetical protein
MNNSQALVSKTISTESLVDCVQKWVLLEGKLKEVNDKIKQMREMKQDLGKKITTYMKENELNSSIEISDGELKLYEKKEYTNLSFGFIEKHLKEIIKDEKQVDFIITYLKSKRETNVVTEIKRLHK